MTIAPTLSGGLKILPEEDEDWMVLLEIADDGDCDLARQFAGLMDEDSMWEDIVMPELESEFANQRLAVVRAVAKARKSGEGEVVIESADAETWYGALNQARLAMESKYKFGPRELRSPEEIEDREKCSAYFREDFYSAIQSLLLRYVMVD